ncbi:hypothetical protein KC640_01920, partial [Candidatus Dojkabacteria bacterium]|nr:hypothetical protein [Candidatus Dojkabacteria bacterium]
GFDLVSGGTDKHLILIDLTNKGVTGKPAAKALAQAGIVLNMNTMPGETRPPSDPSAIRLGTPFITTQGFTEKEMPQIADIIDRVINESKRITDDMGEFELEKFLKLSKKSSVIKQARAEVAKMMTGV